VRRIIDDELDALFPHLPASLIDGPKGVGKTERASQRCRTIRRLDTDPDRAVVAADPTVVAEDAAPVLLDEWQRIPSVWDSVRHLVDEDPVGGRFLLTGSPPHAGYPPVRLRRNWTVTSNALSTTIWPRPGSPFADRRRCGLRCAPTRQ
jgi:hypothetical protein